MARLIDLPLGLGLSSIQPLRGPRTTGDANTESLTGNIQTVSSAFGTQQWQFVFTQVEGVTLRRLRGFIRAMHGGANAARIPFVDYDRRADESGIVGHDSQVAWDNGQPWSNGMQWQVSPPVVKLAAAAAEGDTIIVLTDEHWASLTGIGDWLGFMPFHFGQYDVTQVIDDLTFRIWPPLRKALTVDSYATLAPVMVMRFLSDDGAVWARDSIGARDVTMSMVEVTDDIVRQYFTD